MAALSGSRCALPRCYFAVDELFTAKERGAPTMLATAQQHRPDVRKVDPLKALKGAFLVMDAWGLSNDEARTLLGAPPERTFFSWRAGKAVRVPSDTLRRIGYLAGI